jgi:hypothetical protein
VPDDASGHTDVWERLAAMNRDGAHRPLSLTFRDESERLDFHIEMVHLNILANLWKMTEHVKLLNKYLDRQAAAGPG